MKINLILNPSAFLVLNSRFKYFEGISVKFLQVNFFDLLDVENGGISRGNECLRFDDIFGQPIDQTSCHIISSRECVRYRLGVYRSYTRRMHSLSTSVNQVKMGFKALGFFHSSQLSLGLDYIRSYLGFSSSLGSIHDADNFCSDLIFCHWDQGLRYRSK